MMYRSLRYTTALISSHQTHSEELVTTLSFHLPSKTAQKPNVPSNVVRRPPILLENAVFWLKDANIFSGVAPPTPPVGLV